MSKTEADGGSSEDPTDDLDSLIDKIKAEEGASATDLLMEETVLYRRKYIIIPVREATEEPSDITDDLTTGPKMNGVDNDEVAEQ